MHLAKGLNIQSLSAASTELLLNDMTREVLCYFFTLDPEDGFLHAHRRKR